MLRACFPPQWCEYQWEDCLFQYSTFTYRVCLALQVRTEHRVPAVIKVTAVVKVLEVVLARTVNLDPVAQLAKRVLPAPFVLLAAT